MKKYLGEVIKSKKIIWCQGKDTKERYKKERYKKKSAVIGLLEIIAIVMCDRCHSVHFAHFLLDIT